MSVRSPFIRRCNMNYLQSNMTREESTDLRREIIVQAALRCFVDKGFHQASMRDIAAMAGVSVGNLYNYFPAKEVLIAEIASVEMRELAPLLDALEDANSIDDLLKFAKTYTALSIDPYSVMLTSEVIAESARNPALASLFAENHRKLVAALSSILQAGMRDGNMDSTLPADTTAALILDTIEGYALRAVLFGSKKSQRKKTEDDLAQLLRKLLQP